MRDRGLFGRSRRFQTPPALLQLFAETMSFGLRLRERDQREKIEKFRNSVLPSGQSVGVHSVRKTFEVNMP